MNVNVNMEVWEESLNKLPRKGKIINWKTSVENKCVLKFDCYNICGEIKLLKWERINNKTFLLIGYKDKTCLIFVGNFLRCQITQLLEDEIGTLFKLSDDGTYWIGITQNKKEFWFNGDDKIIEYIKSMSWNVTKQKYVQNRNGEKLHRIIMGETDPNIYIDHINNDRTDNRRENLRLSNHIENAKNIKAYNNTGITGFYDVGNNKYRGMLSMNRMRIQTEYKEYNEALIDTLIIQQYYGFRHNEHLYHMLEDVSPNYKNKLIDEMENKFSKLRNKQKEIICNNKFELSEDKSFYWVIDNNNNRCKISLQDIDIAKKGNWYLNIKQNNRYFRGEIVKDNKKVATDIHRHILNITDIKYKRWFVDHLNGDGLDNRRENLVITDASGNGVNKKGKNYKLERGKYNATITLFGERIHKLCDTEQEAMEFVKQKREEAKKRRVQFHSKKELDTYLENLNLRQAI